MPDQYQSGIFNEVSDNTSYKRKNNKLLFKITVSKCQNIGF
jgi:hypothetical protein